MKCLQRGVRRENDRGDSPEIVAFIIIFKSIKVIDLLIGVGRFRILGGGQGGGQIPSRHMTSY